MVNTECLAGAAFQAESGGHTFQISGVDDTGAAVALSGTVGGVFRRPDNADIALIGSSIDGVASVTLTEDCYAVPGRFGLVIYVTSNNQKVAVYSCVGTVAQTNGGAVAGSTPQDVVDLINAIEAAVATIPPDYTGLTNDALATSRAVMDISIPLPVYADWEAGGISDPSGNENTSAYLIRTRFFPISENTILNYTGTSGRIIYNYFYDKNKTYIGRSASTVPAGACFVRFTYGFSSSSGTTVADYGFDNLVADWSMTFKPLYVQDSEKLDYLSDDIINNSVDFTGISWYENYRIDSDGDSVAQTNDNRSDYVPVIPGSTIILHNIDTRTDRCVYGYNRGKQKVGVIAGNSSSGSTVTEVTVNIPADVYYLRITAYKEQTVTAEYLDICNTLKNAAESAMGAISNSGVKITASNKASYFTDADNAPVNTVYFVDAGAEMAHTPYGKGTTSAAAVYDNGLVRDFAGYISGVLMTYGVSSGNNKIQLYVTGQIPGNQPTILHFRTFYNNYWTDWRRVGDNIATSASNIAIRKKMIAPFLDSQGNFTTEDTGIPNPQCMVGVTANSGLIFDDFDNAPLQSVYQIDLDCTAEFMAHNPAPGKSSILLTTGFSFFSRHGLMQLCIGKADDNGGTFAYLRYGYQQSASEYVFTDWVNLNIVPALPTADGTYTLKATVTGGVATVSWVAD